MVVEDGGIVVLLVVLGGIDRKGLGWVGDLVVSEGLGGKGFECMNGSIGEGVGEVVFVWGC